MEIPHLDSEQEHIFGIASQRPETHLFSPLLAGEIGRGFSITTGFTEKGTLVEMWKFQTIP